MITALKSSLRELYFVTYRNAVISRVRAAFISFEQEYRKESEMVCENILSLLNPELTVLSGPFEGLRYPSYESAGSALAPKLLGTYEKELHPYIYRMLREPYSYILDIGSAEGYYAVGFALASPQTKIIAFDIDPRARYLLKKMSETNHVVDRVEIEASCEPHILVSYNVVKRGLIISDCEGYELHLFKEPLIYALRHFDFLIETHDSLCLKTTKSLIKDFSKTHGVTLIKGEKRTKKDFPVRGAPFRSRDQLMAMDEGRYRLPKWLFCTSILV